ncbi:MAG TPA: type II toxin-antitoxin system prevent-host-death family antitoxin [Thermoanaerobaculia bacterium]|jgi:prevent-host-death family protein|nr:type II toxin-antitoxin system prevent-host-death family antitoxin [Thermoanaerobaculia bacterium]
MTKIVSVSDVEWPEILDDVQKHHVEIVVTRDGEPIAKVVPVEAMPRRMRTLEELRGSVTFLGDIVEPLDEEWDVEK